MMLMTKGLAILQGDKTVTDMSHALALGAQVMRGVESSLPKHTYNLMVRLSPHPSHDFELIARVDGLLIGKSQRLLADAMLQYGYQGEEHSGQGWTALLFDIRGLRFAVIWPTEKEE